MWNKIHLHQESSVEGEIIATESTQGSELPCSSCNILRVLSSTILHLTLALLQGRYFTYHSLNWMEWTKFVISSLSFCSSLLFLGLRFLTAKIRRLHQVDFYFSSKISWFCNSMYNLQTKANSLFRRENENRWIRDNTARRVLNQPLSQRELFSLIVLCLHLDISLLLSVLLNQVHSLVFSFIQ